MTPNPMTLGAAASAAWLEQRGLTATTAHWYVEITIDTDRPDTTLAINIYPEEWGFVFRHGSRVSSIRITDVAFVHGQDDHGLLLLTPRLENVDILFAELEQRDRIVFHCARAHVRTNLIRGTGAVRLWLGRIHRSARMDRKTT